MGDKILSPIEVLVLRLNVVYPPGGVGDTTGVDVGVGRSVGSAVGSLKGVSVGVGVSVGRGVKVSVGVISAGCPP